jgi:hypothetical protein
MEHLLHSTKTSNHKGLVETIFAIPFADITAFPSTVSGTFTLASTKFFKRIQITAGTGKLVTKTVGGGPRQMSNETTLDFKRAVVDAEGLAWLKENQNEELVFVLPNRNGVQVIMGDAQQGVYLAEGTIDTGAAAADEAGLTCQFRHEGPQPMVWTGTPALA